jgi:nitroreductase
LTQRTSALALTDPAPDSAQLDKLLAAACAVPDHSSLRPFRFVVVRGDARRAFGEALARVAIDRDPNLGDFAREKLVQKAYFAPCLVALVASPRPGVKVPVWEQEATAACSGFALVLAAEALGFGAVWKSAPVHEGAALTELLGLGPAERFLGWVNLGTHARETRPRPVEDVSVRVRTL